MPKPGKEAKCCYYKFHTATTICCEGIIHKKNLGDFTNKKNEDNYLKCINDFPNQKAREKHMKEYCKDIENYNNCEHAKANNEKY